MRQLKINEDYIQSVLADVRKQLETASVNSNITYKVELEKTKLKDEEKVKIYFDEKAYYKMQELIKQSEKEIGWDGIVERDENDAKTFFIRDIIVFPQTVTGVTVNTDDEKYSVWINTLDDETFNKRRFNGHSHVRMGVTPSGTDMTYREQSLKNVKDFFIFGIFNKLDASNFAVYDIENNVIYDNDDIDMYIPIPDYSDWAKDVIKENVTQSYSYSYPTAYSYNNSHLPNKQVAQKFATQNQINKTPKVSHVETYEYDEDYWNEYYNERYGV